MGDNLRKKLDFSHIELEKLDLTRKYDDDFSSADGLSFGNHALLYAIAILLGIFLLWSNFTTLDEVSRGIGKVIPSSQDQVIQNLEGGIIDEILVKSGDVVQQGQTLLRMRDIQAKADFMASNQKYYGLMATTIRLEAEADGTDLSFPDIVLKNAPDSVKEEQDTFTADEKQQAGQLSVLQDQQSQKDQEVTELEHHISDTSGVLLLAEKERGMVAPMVKRGAANKMELLQLDRQIAQQHSELNALKLALPRAQSAVKEAKSRMDELSSTFKAQAQKDLAEKTIELNTIKQTLAAYKDRSERTDIKSPVLGKVKDIKITTIGGVVKPGEPIMEIVPLKDQLIVEAQVRPADIAFINVGQKAIVRISAFDFSIYGALTGTVTEISPDSIANEKGQSFYRVRVRTDKTELKKGSKEYHIIPGMQATVDIVTGHKTVMDYLLKPFKKASRTALRER